MMQEFPLASFSPADPLTQLHGARGLCIFASSGCFFGSRAAVRKRSRGSSIRPVPLHRRYRWAIQLCAFAVT